MSNSHLEEWSMDNNMVSKIWVGMSTTNIHLQVVLQFKIQSHLQNASTFRSYSEEKTSKISYITFPILPFFHENTLTKLPSWVLWSLLFLMKPFHSFNLKCVTYTQPIPVPLIMTIMLIAHYFEKPALQLSDKNKYWPPLIYSYNIVH